jgi:hypothetical protein
LWFWIVSTLFWSYCLQWLRRKCQQWYLPWRHFHQWHTSEKWDRFYGLAEFPSLRNRSLRD